MFRSFRMRGVLFFIGTTIALLAMLVGIIAVKEPFKAHAAMSNTLYVNHSPSAGSNTSCTDPGYNSVQAAVDAASKGDTVYLCDTTPYTEQVVITKAITLTGVNEATIQSPAVFPPTASRLPPQFTSDNLFLPQAIVVVWGAGSNANIVNLNITGPLPGNGGCADEEYGVLVIARGTATLKGDHVTDIRDSNPGLYGCQFGVAIQVGREYWPTADFSNFLVENFVGHATITKTTVTGYQKNGITVDGPGSKSNITKSTVKGAGRNTALGNITAQNGIQISRGAVAMVESNFVADNSYTGTAPNASSGGILVFGGCGDPLSIGVEVEGNVLSNNDVGIYLTNYNAACNAQASQKTYDKALNNTISNNAVTNTSSYTDANGHIFTGYQAGIDDVGNNDLISHNTITGMGYTPAQTTPGGPFVIPIDTISFPTTHPRIRSNRII
ncbi:MAG: hypothetical protein ACR2H5_12650 [Ktedonobacteraceae bacterium]